MSPVARRLLLVLSIVLVLLIVAASLFVRFWLDPLLKTTLEEHVAESSKGMYALRIEQLHVNPFTGSAEADGIQLSTDSIRWDSIRLVNPDAAPMKVDGQIRRLRVKNLGLIKYWRSKDISLSKIFVLDPEINLSSVQDTALEKAPKKDSLIQGMLDRLPLLISPIAKSIHIGSVTSTNGKISYRNFRMGKWGYQQADSINLFLTDINVLANDTMETGKALYAEHISLSLHNYEWYPTGDLYGYRIQSVSMPGQDEPIHMTGVSILPKVADETFMQRLKVRTPRLKIRIADIQVDHFNLFQALHKKAIKIETLTVEKALIDVYQNKNLPLSQQKRMPHELFRAIKPYLNIDTILVRNANVLYTELQGNQEGQLEFEHLQGVILNISNDTLKMSDASPARLDVRAELMGAGLLDVSLQIPLLATNFRCDYSAHLGKTDMTYLNRLVAGQQKFRVESGNAETIELKVQVRNGLATGQIEATYNDLKISILDEKDGRKKKFISVVANMVIRGNNGHENMRPFKVGNINYRREPGDGILRFIWRAVQTGLMETLLPRNLNTGKLPD